MTDTSRVRTSLQPLFDSLPDDIARELAERSVQAIQGSSRWAAVWPRFALWLLTEELPQRVTTTTSQAALAAVAELYEERVGRPRGAVDRESWEAAQQTVRDAYAVTADGIFKSTPGHDIFNFESTAEGIALAATTFIAAYFTARAPSQSAYTATVSAIARFFTGSSPDRPYTDEDHAAGYADHGVHLVATAAAQDAEASARESYYAVHSSPRMTYAAARSAYIAAGSSNSSSIVYDASDASARAASEVYYAARSAGHAAYHPAATACYLRELDKLFELLAAGK
ncbi:MAG: hypothetical protein ACLPGW_06985 [Roseiarcus sp.]